MRIQLAVLFMGLTALTSGCSTDGASDEQLATTLRRTLAPLQRGERQAQVFQLADLTEFPWDSVYFFKGEEDDRVIAGAIGFEWIGPDVPNLYTRVLFTRQAKVVRFVDRRDPAKARRHVLLLCSAKRSKKQNERLGTH
jgi:hypothetical protein